MTATHEPLFAMGVGPDGRPFLVHATAAPEYGAGALEGLLVGLCLRPDGSVGADTPALVGVAAALVASLMERGMFRADDVAERYRGWPAPPAAEAPLRVVPIALFYAGQPDELRAGVLGEAALTGAAPRATLAAAAVAAAVSAGTFDLAKAYDMAVAAVQGLDAAAVQLGDEVAALAVRDDLRRAVAATTVDGLGDADVLGAATRRAFWHLLHSDDFAVALVEVAAHSEPIATALTGVLLGACLGAEAIPAPWRDAVAARVAPLTALLAVDA
jgi:hypothetical protein